MDKPSTDYHDYVFKDGKFVGKFEDMYRNSLDVPWHQDCVPGTWHGKIGTCLIEAAFEELEVNTVIEVGCGYGNILAQREVQENVTLAGFDISPTAIIKAKELHPNCIFFVDELVDMKHEGSYDLVICRETLWYVVDNIDAALSNLANLVRPSGCLYVGLSFPKLSNSFYGKDKLPTPEALIEKLEIFFDSVAVNYLYKKRYTNDGPNLHWLGKRR